jgi:hypothetical protein
MLYVELIGCHLIVMYILGWFFVYSLWKTVDFFTRLVDVFHDTVDQERKVGKFSVRFRQKI